MKKGLLLIATAALCANAFAQQECGYLNTSNASIAAAWNWSADDNKFDSSKVSREAGTVIAETESVVLSTSFLDNCCGSNINKLSLTSYVVNNVAYSKESNANDPFEGAVGETNPSAITDINNPAITKGWVFDYDVKANGYLTVFAQASLNKNNYVIAGEMANGEVSVAGVIAYEMYIELASEVAGLDGTSFKIALPSSGEEGILDTTAADIANYVEDGTGCIMWPYRILVGGDKEATADSYPSANAAFVFPVMADVHYYVFATGSKMTGGPYVFTKEKPTQLAFLKDVKDEEGNVTDTVVMNMIGEYTGEGSVNGIAAANDENAPIYNMLGVRVNSDAKGILIQNGKKFIRK